MKRRLLALSVLLIGLSILAYGSLAYFTGEDIAHNVIKSGNVSIDLLEWADEEKTVPFPADGLENVMPGTQITKIAEVKNTGSHDAYIRVAVEKSLVLPEGVTGEVDLSLMDIAIDTEYWTLGEDGYYYYNTPLAPGAVTEPLFTAVSFDADMDNLYQNSTALVDVKAQAVQSANNPIPQGGSITDVAGWPK